MMAHHTHTNYPALRAVHQAQTNRAAELKRLSLTVGLALLHTDTCTLYRYTKCYGSYHNAHNLVALVIFPQSLAQILLAPWYLQLTKSLLLLSPSTVTWHSVTRAGYFHIRTTRHIRTSLTEDMAKTVTVSMVHSWLHYADSVVHGLTNIKRQQSVQNSVASCFEKIAPICLLVNSCLNYTGYLFSL